MNKNLVKILAGVLIVIIIITVWFLYARKSDKPLGDELKNGLSDTEIQKGLESDNNGQNGQGGSSDGGSSGSDSFGIEYLGDGYTRNSDSGEIYYDNNLVEGADGATFAVSSGGYAEDKNNAYFKGVKSEGDNNNESNNSDDSSDIINPPKSSEDTTSCVKGPGVSKFGKGIKSRPTMVVCELGECGECNF